MRQSTLSLWHKATPNDMDQTILKLLTRLKDWYGVSANSNGTVADGKKDSDGAASARYSFPSRSPPPPSPWNRHPHSRNRSTLSGKWAGKSHAMGEGGKSIYFEKEPSICDRVRRCMPRNMNVGSAILVVKLATNKVQEDRRAEELAHWRRGWVSFFSFFLVSSGNVLIRSSFAVSRTGDPTPFSILLNFLRKPNAIFLT